MPAPLSPAPGLVGIHALWPPWSLALGVAAYACYIRRPGRCEACGRH